jgi:hypothetical protein
MKYFLIAMIVFIVWRLISATVAARTGKEWPERGKMLIVTVMIIVTIVMYQIVVSLWHVVFN